MTSTGRLVPGHEDEHARRLRAEGVAVAEAPRPRRRRRRRVRPGRGPTGEGGARTGATARQTRTDGPVAPTDLDQGSFSDTPPWTIDDPEALPWRQGLAEVRARVVAEVPALTTPGRWPPGRRLVTVTRRLGTPWPCGPCGERTGGAASRAGISRRLRLAAERLGPTYIKLGQIISSGEGIFPAELVGEFTRCRDQVPAEPFRVVREVIEADLGRPLDEVFRWVDRTPLAAASIAQVHAATLRTGEQVVVKVQRPTVAALVRDDLRVMAWLAPQAGRAHPHRGPGQPAGAGRAVRPDHHRGARLPARGREHARHRPHVRRARPAGLRDVPRPHPELVTRGCS